MRPSICFCLFLLLPFSLLAQRFGGTPPCVQWKQINTDTARIIYPEGLDSQAQRVADLVHRQAGNQGPGLGDRTKQINIVLQNLTTIANGYVGLGPYRSEFYLTPQPNNFTLGSLPWGDQLAIHEYRHVQQYNNFYHGISRAARILFGEEGYAVATSASVPDWFYEGDAVYTETVLSGQGRGRLPLFMSAYPALWKAGKNYSWMKLRNGSLKDYVPGHYNLGYLLVNYGYGKYGPDFWRKVTHDASAFRGLVYPFQRAIEKYAGESYQSFRRHAFEYYQEQTKPGSDSKSGPNPVYKLNERVLTNYLFPYAVGDSALLYLKVANNKRSVFVLADSAGERAVRVRDISNDQQFSYRNGRIVYAAYENDARWRWRDYSVLKILDLQSRKTKTITRRSRYFTPDISADGSRIAAVLNGLDGSSQIHILNDKGVFVSAIHSADISVFTDPKFLGADSLVTAVRLRDGRMALALADLRTGSLVRLTDPSFNVIGYPCVDEGVIYFTASYGGTDQVYAIRPGEQQIFQLSDWLQGNYFVNVSKGKMSWSAFTADGYQLQQKQLEASDWIALPSGTAAAMQENYVVNRLAGTPVLLSDTGSSRSFASARYAKTTRLFNFHSWRPYYEDPLYSFTIYGQNVLNTLETEISYTYNENDRTSAIGAGLIYGGFYPQISLGTQYTMGRRVRLGTDPNTPIVRWNQLDTRAGLSVPLNWTRGQSYHGLIIGTDYVYRQDFITGALRDSLRARNFGYLRHYLAYSSQVQPAVQHIFPRFGYSVSGDYRHVVSAFNSWQFLGGAALYLPGFFPTHSVVLRGGFQETDTVNVVFANNLAYSRGYNAPYFSRMWRLSGNYHLPLWYPDFGLANIVYLLRVRGNAFFDFTRVYSNNKLAFANQRSVGGELFFDTKWWNQYELSFGLRGSYLLDRDFFTGRSRSLLFEFIVPVSIIPR